MSFGSSMRFEVKDGGKGGIFWQKEKPKQKPRKFGYKSKELRHAIRRPEPEYIEEPNEKTKPSKDFIKRNRERYRNPRQDDDKENQRSSSVGSARPSSSIKPGTVTLTQDQLNALLATVGKLKPGERDLRISIDAENNRLQLESPRDNMDSAPNSSRSDAGDKVSGKEEVSIFDLTKNKNAYDQAQRSSSGYGSEEKSSGGKEVRFNTARNEERSKTPEATPAPPPLVPWRHMTVAERKRLQWAREKAAEEELQKQRKYDPWGRPGAGAPQKPPEPDPQPDSQFRTQEEEKLRRAIDDIEAKYGDLLNLPETQGKATSKSPSGQQEKATRKDGDEPESGWVPGLDSSYVEGSGPVDNKSTASNHLEDKGNTRPPRKGDKRKEQREDRKDKKDDRNAQREDRGGRPKEPRKTGPRRGEEKEEGRRGERNGEEARRIGRQRNEEKEERAWQDETGHGGPNSDLPPVAPAAMQTSLFIGQSEPDNSRFLTKKEEEKKRWLEELDKQREEKRLQKQREKEKQRQGVDDTWADRFAAPSSRPPPQSHPQQQQQQQQQQQPYYATGGAWEKSVARPHSNEAELNALPPAAMRSAMSIGNVAPNTDRIALRQAEEKKLWLEELNKQREEQREARMRLKDKQRASEETWANRFTQDPRTLAAESTHHQVPASYEPPASSYEDATSTRINSAPQPVVKESLDDGSKTYLRGQNVNVDPVTRRELEDKRRKHLEYQAAIKAQIEEKERQKREERERKWREEMEEEKKLQAERDALQRQLEAEDSKNRQKEEARQRQVEQLKSMMDAEQERAQEQRMMKRLTTLQQAGHDVSGLKAHYEAVSPRIHHASVDPASVPGLQPSPHEGYGAANASPRAPGTLTYGTVEGPGVPSLRNSQEVYSQVAVSHEPYTENRVLTPSRFRQTSQPRSFPASPLREFATQTDEQLGLLNGLRKESSEVEIEFRGPPPNKNSNKGSRNARVKSAERRKPAESTKGKPPPSKQTRAKPPPQQQRGRPSAWNYQNPKQKAPVKQSEKDLFYEQKRQESEERRAKRERQLQYLVELNKQVIPTEKEARPNHPTSHHPLNADFDFVDGEEVQGYGQGQGQGRGPVVQGDLSHRSGSPPVNRTGKYRPSNRSRSPPVPAAKRKAGHNNPARDIQTDFDTEAHNYYRPNPGFATPTLDERGNIQAPTKDTDFIPFMRTNDVLDPSKAEEPVQLSRENTRIRQARQHYHENLRPADYGNQLDMYEDAQRQPALKKKDPILNPELVKDYPTARQDQILQQLSSLKQSLIQRRREIETCMSPSDF